MFLFERAVRFEEVDAAHIVYFPRFLSYCHEAMEALLAPLEGGYATLVVQRKLGLPTVHVEMDFTAPLRFGDVARIEVAVEKLGRSSCAFRYALTRKGDGAKVALVKQVCAVSDLTELRAVPIPDDVRAVLAAHLLAAPA